MRLGIFQSFRNIVSKKFCQKIYGHYHNDDDHDSNDNDDDTNNFDDDASCTNNSNNDDKDVGFFRADGFYFRLEIGIFSIFAKKEKK